jgi:hypothetical protein
MPGLRAKERTMSEDNLIPPMRCRHARKAVQEIDACMFSGDSFINDKDACDHLEFYIQRWQRGINGFRRDMAKAEMNANVGHGLDEHWDNTDDGA